MRNSSKTDTESEIIFTGGDGLTCHQFIRSIREQAIDAEKQCDNGWMADYASVRFDGEALKWFESLEDETQVDWKLLRRAIISRYTEPAYEELTQAPAVQQRTAFTFSGKSKDECRLFVQEIRVRASQEGKENDSNWMARLAYPCFTGDALEWHTTLSDDVRTDWFRLERAILVDYPNSPSVDYTRPPAASFSPARIRVEDWFVRVAPSPSMQAIRSREDWLAQAKERRRIYQEAKDKSVPCWLLIEKEGEIPENAVWLGCDKISGKALFSARAWHGDKGLIVGKCGRHFSGASVPLDGKEIYNIFPFEVLVGDPGYFYWVAGPDRVALSGNVKHRPFWGVEAGLELCDRSRATFISQVPFDTGRLPGKVHSPGLWAHGCAYGNEVTTETSAGRVLAWAD